IDFGLALKQEVLGNSTRSRVGERTVIGTAIEGSMDYGAPEQMGKLPGVAVSPASDVYAFGRTCCFALFGTPQPLLRHGRRVPEGRAELLEGCLEEQPRKRPRSFTDVLARLERLSADRAPDSGAIPRLALEAPPAPAAVAEWYYLLNDKQ